MGVPVDSYFRKCASPPWRLTVSTNCLARRFATRHTSLLKLSLSSVATLSPNTIMIGNLVSFISHAVEELKVDCRLSTERKRAYHPQWSAQYPRLAEHWREVDGKRCTSLEAGQVFYAWEHSDVVGYNRVEIEVGKREVHNLLRFSLQSKAPKRWQRSYGLYADSEKTRFVPVILVRI